MKASSTCAQGAGEREFPNSGWAVRACVGSFRKVNVFVINFFLCRTRLFDLKVQSAFCLPQGLPGLFGSLDLVTESDRTCVHSSAVQNLLVISLEFRDLGEDCSCINISPVCGEVTAQFCLPGKDRDVCSLLVP